MNHLMSVAQSPDRYASCERIFLVVVQSPNSVTVEYLFIDFQARVRKKLGWKFLDCETDGIRGARKSTIANRFSPKPSMLGGEQFRLAPGGEQFSHRAVVKCRHSEPPFQCQRI
jgi:hypothetical protein